MDLALEIETDREATSFRRDRKCDSLMGVETCGEERTADGNRRNFPLGFESNATTQ